MDDTAKITRRGALATAGVAAVGSAGCLSRVRNVAGRDRASQVGFEVRTTPADSDPHAIRIARHLAENLQKSGVDARVNTISEAELYRSVLINHDFDIYVGQYPENDHPDPDAMYPLLHSDFSTEPGWQNPFGFTELQIDELLETQRGEEMDDRWETVAEFQNIMTQTKPFITVAFPDSLTAVQDGRFENWEVMRPTSSLGLLTIDRDERAEDHVLRLVTTDTRITENRNPITAEYRRHGTFTGLLYDPLAREYGDDYLPWLAESWSWRSDGTLEITLREANWHDGEPISASDVAFTYEFLTDTSMGEAESPIPTSRFRGRSTLVDEVRVTHEQTVELEFVNKSREVARRILTVPILPEHIWQEYTGPATIAGIEIDQETTEALVWNNPEPVGSGPIQYVDSTAEESVLFERNDDHFLRRDPENGLESGDENGQETGDENEEEYGQENGLENGQENGSENHSERYLETIPEKFVGKPAFEELQIEVVPSDIAAVQRVGDRTADATAANLGPDAVPRIGREADARLVSTRSGAFYHIGFNARRAPLTNPRFRRVIAGHVDKAWLVSETFQGYGVPAATPLAGTVWEPPALEWSDQDPQTPFYGSDGELDVEEARDAFREIGYRYSDDGELLTVDQ